METDGLGVGLVYWPGLEPLLEAGGPSLTSLEIEVEAFWLADPDPRSPPRLDPRAVQRIAALPQAKVIHGIGGPVGGSRGPSLAHLDRIAASVRAFDARWYSEHLAFNGGVADGKPVAAGFLLPPLQDKAGARAAARTIRLVQGYLGQRIAVETGVNYLKPRAWELQDGAFVALVQELADCDLLLDLHNIWTNARNGRQPVADFLAQIDLSRVREIHLAGGIEYRGYWLDAHSGPVPSPVLDLAREVVPRLPALGAIHVEVLPQFIPYLDLEALGEQLREISAIWDTRGSRVAPPAIGARAGDPSRSAHPRAAAPCAPQAFEDCLASLVAGLPVALNSPWALDLAQDPGIALLTDLARTFRAGVVVDHLKMSSRYLILHDGQDAFRGLLNDFWRSQCPMPLAMAEARAFAHWLRGRSISAPHLHSLLDYDLAMLGAGEADGPQPIRFDCEPLGLLRALGEGRLPEHLKPGAFELELTDTQARHALRT